jgi:hypothetical protein
MNPAGSSSSCTAFSICGWGGPEHLLHREGELLVQLPPPGAGPSPLSPPGADEAASPASPSSFTAYSLALFPGLLSTGVRQTDPLLWSLKYGILSMSRKVSCAGARSISTARRLSCASIFSILKLVIFRAFLKSDTGGRETNSSNQHKSATHTTF